MRQRALTPGPSPAARATGKFRPLPAGEGRGEGAAEGRSEGASAGHAPPPLGEFDLIARYFSRPTAERQGIGDDCALLDAGDQTLAITSDMLLEGTHFLRGADAEAVGHKSLAVNLSDLAAAGARPRCFLLDLALPQVDERWLEGFSRGLFALAQAHGCTLVGGDTTRAPRVAGGAGPITIAITAIGTVDPDRYRGRSGARAGDDLWVSGQLGAAMLALAHRRGELVIPAARRAACLLRMDRPEPRVALGRSLAGRASAMIDVSDGLLGDLAHILERSGGATPLGAEIDWPRLPRDPVFDAFASAVQQRCVLAGGDDYELLFTAPVAQRDAIASLASAAVPVTRIGRILAAPGVYVRSGIDGSGALLDADVQSFDHFLAPETPHAD